MELYEGYSVCKGSVLASIAKVRVDFGIPSLTPPRLRALGERLMREPDEESVLEPDQIVLIAKSLPVNLLASAMPGIDIVGVALTEYIDEAEWPLLDGITIPIVAGLGDGLYREAVEFDIIIVDGDRSCVYLAPDADVVSHFQSTGRRKRYFMEGVHVPARTASDNRIVSVFGSVATGTDIDAAMRHGADGIYLTAENDLFGSGAVADGDTQWETLSAIIDACGAKPIILDAPDGSFAIGAALQAAAVCPFSIAVDTVETGEYLRTTIETTIAFAPAHVRFGVPSYLLAIDSFPEGVCASGRSPLGEGERSARRDSDSPSPFQGEGWGGVASDADAASEHLPDDLDQFAGILFRKPLARFETERLLSWLGLARRCGKPAYAPVALDWTDDIEGLLGFGIAGVIAAPAQIDAIKDTVRQL